MLKFGTTEETMQGAERLNKVFTKITSSKAVYALAMLAAFALLSGAVSKFTG